MKSAVITGAAQGIGYAIARRLGRVGQPVVVAGRTSEKVRRAERSLAEAGIEVTGVTVDVLDQDDVIRLVATAVERYGGIQVLVNNAGIFEERHTLELTAEAWDTTIGINLRGALFCARESARHMDETGRIVNISSTSGFVCERGFAAYNASKAGLISLTKSLAVDLADRGIMVNCVAPGWVLTPLTREYLAGVSPETMLRINLLGRAGTPEEIAEVVAFFARPDVTYLTGQTLLVDGGQTVRALLPEDVTA